MRVGYFVETPVEHNLTGGSRSFLDLIDKLVPMGIEPFVVVHEPWALTEEMRNRRIPFITTKMYRPFVGINEKARFYRTKYLIKNVINFHSEITATRFFRKNGVQLVHINSQFCGIIGARVAKNLNLPFIYHIREFLSEGFGVRFYNPQKADQIISQANRLIGISENVTNNLRLRFPNTSVSLVYNGLDYEKIGCSNTKRFLDKRVKMVIVGRVTDKKNQLEAIKAVDILVNRYKRNCSLTVIGYEGKDSYELSIRDYIHKHRLEEYVTLIPFINHPFQEMRKCDIGLICSKSEAFGRVTIESMMNSLLVVASDLETTKEIVKDGIDGILYQLGNYEELAYKVNWIIENPTDANRMVVSGRTKAIEKFAIQKTAQDVMSIYQEIVTR